MGDEVGRRSSCPCDVITVLLPFASSSTKEDAGKGNHELRSKEGAQDVFDQAVPLLKDLLTRITFVCGASDAVAC